MGNLLIMTKKSYSSFNLPTDLIEELKIWRQAYMIAAGRTVSYGEMIRGWIDGIDSNEPDVTKAMDMIIGNHPELMEKIGKYRGIDSEEETPASASLPLS